MRLKIKYAWGPSCWFFDEAMAAHKFNGTEHAILWLMRRVTFGEPDRERPGYRKESVCLSIDEIQRRTGRAPSAIRKALDSLEKANVLIVLAPAHGTKARELGINSRIDEWTVPRIGEIDQSKYPGAGCLKRGTLDGEKTELKRGTLAASIEAPSPPQLRHPSRAQSRAAQGREPSLRDLQRKRSPIVPKRDDLDRSFLEAQETYREHTGYSLNRREKAQLEEFLERSPRKDALLKIWSLAVEAAQADREQRLSDNETATFVAKRPFSDVYAVAATAYAKIKARKRQQDRPERLTAA